VATQNGHPAEIQETENVIIQQQTQTSVPNVGIQITTTFQQLGLPIDLKVTPRITDDGRITTDINASITSQSGPAPANGPPPTNVQTATTKLTTKNGETIVIGGLVREVATDQVNGVPLLSSIPILGTLFQDHEKVNRKEELIIFITPTILED
jgi:type II secretory pathway component GspD/PulD (secretin)